MKTFSWRHIEIFRAVMTTKNLTDAAQLLRTSQPTVSREISRLEKLLRFRLFDRIKGRLLPTAQGLRLFAEVERSYYGLERISNMAEIIRQLEILSSQLPAYRYLVSRYYLESVSSFCLITQKLTSLLPLKTHLY